MTRLRGRRRTRELGKCNFAQQILIPIVIQLGGEGRFKQTGALMPHCLSEDSYLLLGSSPAFRAFRWGCCCFLRKKNSANFKKKPNNTRTMGVAWLCIFFLFSSVNAEKFGGLVQKKQQQKTGAINSHICREFCLYLPADGSNTSAMRQIERGIGFIGYYLEGQQELHTGHSSSLATWSEAQRQLVEL